MSFQGGSFEAYPDAPDISEPTTPLGYRQAMLVNNGQKYFNYSASSAACLMVPNRPTSSLALPPPSARISPPTALKTARLARHEALQNLPAQPPRDVQPLARWCPRCSRPSQLRKMGLVDEQTHSVSQIRTSNSRLRATCVYAPILAQFGTDRPKTGIDRKRTSMN